MNARALMNDSRVLGLLFVAVLPTCTARPADVTAPALASSESPPAARSILSAQPSPSAAPAAAAPASSSAAPAAASSASAEAAGPSATQPSQPAIGHPKRAATLCEVTVDGLVVLRECSGAPGETPSPAPSKPGSKRECAVTIDGLEILRPCTGAPNEHPARRSVSPDPNVKFCEVDDGGVRRIVKCPK